MLNERLLKNQKVSKEAERKIEELHEIKDSIFELAGKLDIVEDFNFLVRLVEYLENLEYRAQELWGFEQSSDYHSWWCLMPHCKCPKFFNLSSLGEKFYSSKCELH